MKRRFGLWLIRQGERLAPRPAPTVEITVAPIATSESVAQEVRRQLVALSQNPRL